MSSNGGAPAKWAWADLHETGPEAESRAQEAERQRKAVEDAYRRGFDEGHHAGLTTARDELKAAVHALETALEEIQASKESWEARLEERLLVLAAAMAQKVIERTRAQDPTVFTELAKKAVASFPVEEPVRIRLHPSDQNVLTKGGFLSDVVAQRSVRWVPDDQVIPGGCIVEGPDKIVDARVDEALVRVVRALTDG